MVKANPMTQRTIGKFILAILLTTWSLVAFADLQATVDRTRVSELDLINLTVRLSGQDSRSSPDFSVLRKDFDVVSQSGPNQSSEYSFINGRQSSETHTEWTVTLRARHFGKQTIPPIRLGSQSTQPITIDVVKAGPATTANRANQPVFLETSVDTNSTYVQGQIIYTVKLYYGASISGNFPGAPDIDNAVVETVEKQKRYQSIVGNRRFYVMEAKYAIYPQQSGKLVLPRETFSGTQGGSGGFFSFTQAQPVHAISDSHTIIVKPQPKAFTGDQWLPARDLTLTESWGNKGVPTFRVGEPINRILTLTAKGVSSSQLPPFPKLDLPNAKIYTDPADRTDQPDPHQGMVSTESTTIGIVPTEAGKLTLPEIRIPWWNTRTDKMEVATIPEETYTIAPAPPGSSVTLPATPAATPTTQQQAQAPTSQVVRYIPSKLWMYVLAALTVLWLFSTWQWLATRRRLTTRLSGIETETEPETRGITEKAAWDIFEGACKQGNADRARSALFVWAKLRNSGINSLRDLAARNDALQKEIETLDNTLYSPQSEGAWQGNNLLEAAKTLRSTKPEKPKHTALHGSLNPV